MDHDLIVLYEHPEWQKPLLAALERRGVSYGAFDLKRAAFDPDGVPAARVYFNQASPSAYVRGNARRGRGFNVISPPFYVLCSRIRNQQWRLGIGLQNSLYIHVRVSHAGFYFSRYRSEIQNYRQCGRSKSG